MVGLMASSRVHDNRREKAHRRLFRLQPPIQRSHGMVLRLNPVDVPINFDSK